MNDFPRTDGIYQGTIQVNDYGFRYRKYLRFYATGEVLSCSSTGTVHEIARWFNRTDFHDVVSFTQTGNTITFTELTVDKQRISCECRKTGNDAIELLIRYGDPEETDTLLLEFVWFEALP